MLLSLLSRQEECVQCSEGNHPGRCGSQAGSCGANLSVDGVIAHSLAFLFCVTELFILFQFLIYSGVFQPPKLHLGALLSSLLP